MRGMLAIMPGGSKTARGQRSGWTTSPPAAVTPRRLASLCICLLDDAAAQLTTQEIAMDGGVSVRRGFGL